MLTEKDLFFSLGLGCCFLQTSAVCDNCAEIEISSQIAGRAWQWIGFISSHGGPMYLGFCPLKVVLKMVLRGRAMNIRGEKRRERKLRVLAKCKNGLEVTLRDYICLPYFLPSFFSCDCRSDASYDHVCEGSLQDFFFIFGWHR